MTSRMTVNRVVHYLLIFNVFRFETLMVVGSAYASVILILWPEYVFRCTKELLHLEALSHSRGIGVLLLIAAIATTVGIVLRIKSRRVQWSTRLRMAALVVHGCFWFVLGTTMIMDIWHTSLNLVAGMFMAIGLMSPLTIAKIALVDPRTHI